MFKSKPKCGIISQEDCLIMHYIIIISFTEIFIELFYILVTAIYFCVHIADIKFYIIAIKSLFYSSDLIFIGIIHRIKGGKKKYLMLNLIRSLHISGHKPIFYFKCKLNKGQYHTYCPYQSKKHLIKFVSLISIHMLSVQS